MTLDQVGRAIELMFIDILLLADKVFEPPLSQRIFRPELFLYLTDGIMESIEQSQDPVCVFIFKHAVSLIDVTAYGPCTRALQAAQASRFV